MTNSITELKDHFDKFSETRDKFRNKGRYYHDYLENYLQFLIPEDASVLELGCGTGHTLAKVGDKSKNTGIDISSEMIEQARSNYPDMDFRLDNANDLQLNQTYDVILLINTMGYLEDIQSALESYHKVCHSDTRIIAIYFNYLWKPVLSLTEKLKLRMPGLERHWLPISDIENMFELADFEMIKYDFKVLLPAYIPLLSNFFNRFLANLPLFRKLALNSIFIARSRKQISEEKESSVSVVVPCRNEEKNVEPAVQQIPTLGSHTEIIYVEGNSQDNTYQECLRVQKSYPDSDIKVLQQDGKGKADAVYKGFDHASGEILMILDGDLTVPPSDLTKFYNAINSNKGEFINGSRLVYDMEKEAMRPLNLLGNKFFSIVFSYLLSQRLRDTLCGTKVLRKKEFERIKKGRSYFGDFDPFGDFDLLFGASKLNLKIVEIPIRYRSRSYGETQISRFSHGWLLLKMVAFASRKIKFL